MKYGDTAIAAEPLPHGTAVIVRDGKVYRATYADSMHIFGNTWGDVEEGDTVRLDPPPGIFRKVATEEKSHG